MDVIAHRGFAATGVENARSTLREAVARADGVEFDVRLAADGEPVVFHDERVDRLTDREGCVADFTAAELGGMCLADTHEGIPALARVLDALTGPIVPELKTEAVPDRVVSLLAAYPDPVLVSSFRPSALEALPEAFDRAVLCGTPAMAADLPEGSPAGLDRGLAVARWLDAAAIHPHHSLCSPEAVADCHAAGLAVNAWTVRSRDVGRAMRKAGVDGAITDDPAYVGAE